MVQTGSGRCGKLNLESLDTEEKMICADDTSYPKVPETRSLLQKDSHINIVVNVLENILIRHILIFLQRSKIL
jgi:hypothetical protein